MKWYLLFYFCPDAISHESFTNSCCIIICLSLRYRQMFDLEGETGLVVRGIGTAVTLSRSNHPEGIINAVNIKEYHNGRE